MPIIPLFTSRGHIPIGIVFILKYACMVKVVPIVEKVIAVVHADSIINRYQLIALVVVGELIDGGGGPVA